MGTLVQLLLSFSYFKSLFSCTKLYCVSFRLFRFVSLRFISLIFAKMTFSKNTKFRENALYFREITKLVSLPFLENFAKRNSVKNPTASVTLFVLQKKTLISIHVIVILCNIFKQIKIDQGEEKKLVSVDRKVRPRRGPGSSSRTHVCGLFMHIVIQV